MRDFGQALYANLLRIALLGVELWETVAKTLGVLRLAKGRRVSKDDFRTPQVQLLLGCDGWVTHRDNGIL